MTDKILVIEDNDQNLYLVTFLLKQSGFAVIAARNGQDGIDLACREGPALILLDIQLPLMNGYEVARKLRGINAVKSIPIIAVTSYAMMGDREKAFEAGCTGYVEKPINPSTFMDEIKKYLRTESIDEQTGNRDEAMPGSSAPSTAKPRQFDNGSS